MSASLSRGNNPTFILRVNSDMPENMLRLMQLYPQPMRRQPSVEYVPLPYRSPVVPRRNDDFELNPILKRDHFGASPALGETLWPIILGAPIRRNENPHPDSHIVDLCLRRRPR